MNSCLEESCRANSIKSKVRWDKFASCKFLFLSKKRFLFVFKQWSSLLLYGSQWRTKVRPGKAEGLEFPSDLPWGFLTHPWNVLLVFRSLREIWHAQVGNQIFDVIYEVPGIHVSQNIISWHEKWDTLQERLRNTAKFWMVLLLPGKPLT